MTPTAWFAALNDALTDSLSDSGVDATPQQDISDETRDLLLDLARIAAHRAERWTAPLSTFIAGNALAGATDDQRNAVLRTLISVLDADDPGSGA